MGTRKLIREYRRVFEALGCAVLEVTTGRHLHIRVDCRGHEHTFVGSMSPSDQRQMRNFKAVARRWVNEVTGQSKEPI